MTQDTDIIVIGAGIAGVSAAAELAASARVMIIEMETQPGYHASGRSAAYFAPAYGNRTVRGLTAASEAFYRDPPDGFADVELINRRHCVFIAREDQQQQLQAMQAENPQLQTLSAAELRKHVPILAPGYAAAGLLDASGGDLDVHGILQAYLRRFRQRGGSIQKHSRVEALARSGGQWQVKTARESFRARIIVNAAGAWADHLAGLAGIGTLGITPMRRTAMLIDPPGDLDINDWPLAIDADEAFYFKPDAGKILLSPADETPSEPCDAQADELDIALAVDRFERATGLEVGRVNHRWAGLRSFAPDRTFVAGLDPRIEGFFWLAGQGGYGVQSAPALAALSRHLLCGAELEPGFVQAGQFIDAVAPARLLSGEDLDSKND